MPDWTKSMRQYFEYYLVDPDTWGDAGRIDHVESCSISWDLGASTLGSASIETTDDLGECYIRPYLVTIQNGRVEKFPQGTFLVQTPSTTFNGKYSSITLDAYTPLLELKDCSPPLGYTILKGENIMTTICRQMEEHCRAPIVETKSNATIPYDFVANVDDSWLTYGSDAIAYAKLYFGLDEKGRVLFIPKIDIAKMRPTWTYTDDNSSIIQPEISVDRDLYGIPNVVEVIYSKDNKILYSQATNDDPNSPISTTKRGRVVLYRDSNPQFAGEPTQDMVDEYAKQLLESLSTLTYTLKYKHGYCPVKIGDCVRLNYRAAGLENLKAKVTAQTYDCKAGCQVEETAVYTRKLWEG